MANRVQDLIRDLKMLSDPEIAKASSWFFKTSKGEYGYGDIFLGIRVPVVRKVAAGYRDLSLVEIEKLAESKFHEVRFAALTLLVNKFKSAKSEPHKKLAFDSFLKLLAAGRVNNWDLVDSSAPYLAEYLVANPSRYQNLKKLAVSKNLWEQRSFIMFSAAFIRVGNTKLVFDLVPQFLDHPHDLIHKACGWMLREAGKKDLAGLRKFLAQYTNRMPRVMLRYSIEKLSATERAKWLAR